jgi:hypothetical protein
LSNGNGAITNPFNRYNEVDLIDHRQAIARAISSAEGKAAFREALLGSEFGIELCRREFGAKIIHRDTDTRPIVAVLIPTHKKPENETGSALDKMLAYSKDFCHVVMRPLIASSVVHWVRNQLLANLYASNIPFDYVLFMDDDMTPPPEAIQILLERKVDIVSAICTVRQDPPLPNARYMSEKTFQFQTADIDQPGFWNVGAVGTGFMLITKKALDIIGEYTLSLAYDKKFLGMREERALEIEKAERERCAKDNNQFWFQFLRHPSGCGEMGEDMSFCFKARECGFEVYGDSTFLVGHIGNYAFGLQDYWHYREQALAEGKVIPVGPPQSVTIPEYKSDTKISLLIPTRGRPDNIIRLLKSLHETSHVMPNVVCRIDDDDEDSRSALHQLVAAGADVSYQIGNRETMTKYWNDIARATSSDILMFAADDICFRTKGWDSLVRRTFDEHPDKMIFVHGDDGHWGNQFGTHGFLHRKWVDALGYVLPPYFSSDFGDTWINDIANSLGRRVFLPILTEHMHPLWGKAKLDKTYQERLERGEKDGVRELYVSLAHKRKEDAEKIKAAILAEQMVAVG